MNLIIDHGEDITEDLKLDWLVWYLFSMYVINWLRFNQTIDLWLALFSPINLLRFGCADWVDNWVEFLYVLTVARTLFLYIQNIDFILIYCYRLFPLKLYHHGLYKFR